MPISTNDGQYFENEAEFLLADNIPLESPRKPAGASKSKSGSVPTGDLPLRRIEDMPYEEQRQWGLRFLKEAYGIDIDWGGPYNDSPTDAQKSRDMFRSGEIYDLKREEQNMEDRLNNQDWTPEEFRDGRSSDIMKGGPGADDLSSPPAKRSIWDQLTGADGGERFQTFPERAVRETLENIRTFMTTEPGSEENIQASARVGFDLGLGGLVTAPMRTGAGMFGGKLSKQAVKFAEEMEKNKASEISIKEMTGLERGTDGKWRKEFSDDKALYKGTAFKTIKGAPNKFAYLDEVLVHEELYKQYPELRNIDVFEVPDLDVAGKFNSNHEGRVAIFVDKGLDPEEKLKTLLHEAQHAIQYVEKFAMNALSDLSPEVREKMRNEALDLALKTEMLQPVLKEIQKLMSSGKIEEADKMVEDLVASTRHHIYKRLASETEARNTETRMFMSDKERRQSLGKETEDIERDYQILVKDGQASK